VDIAGIICEYNPFHNGHAYQIDETRRVLPGCAVVCCMSGDFTQRGEPAVFGKYARAAAAVTGGADLVLELPLVSSVSSAEGFAAGGVALLEATGVCTHISFGSECGDISALEEARDALLSDGIDARIKAELALGKSYAGARYDAVKARHPAAAELLTAPNDILGVEYLKAITTLGSSLIPVCVTRRGDGHDEGTSSGKALREAILRGEDVWDAIPAAAADIFKNEIECGRGPVCAQLLEQIVLAKLRTMTAEQFDALPGASEGLGRRLLKFRDGATLEAIAAGTKTKRYAMSRIRRMMLCAVLDITSEDSPMPEYIRPLAANERGRQILSQMRKTARLPIITKPASARRAGEASERAFLKTALAHDLYVLAYREASERAGGGDFTAQLQLMDTAGDEGPA